MPKRTLNPHDKLFKDLIREKSFAQAFLQQHLTKDDLLLVDLYHPHFKMRFSFFV